MNNSEHTQRGRIIFFHKHGTSARTRFLRFTDDTVCGFAPLPQLSAIMEEGYIPKQPAVEAHPATMLQQGAQRLQLDRTVLALETQYNEWVDAPGGAIRILLARFTAIDPPFEAAEALGARFIDLTEARDLPSVELLLLRKAYEVILGG